VSLLASCGSPTPPRRDVVIGLIGEPDSVFADDVRAQLLEAAVTESLVRRDAREELVARLAEAVPTFENGGLRFVTDDPSAPSGRLVAVFRLRDNARWQDGRPITAPDVRFAYEEDRGAAVGTERRYRADRIEAVEVIDDRSVRVLYRAGERWPDYALAPRVMPRHILSGATPDARTAYARRPVHAGPFAVAAWIGGFGVTLSAFPDYVLGRPPLGRIEVRFLRDRAAMLDALRRGDIDVAPSPALEADLAGVVDEIADDTDRSGLRAFYTQTEGLEVLRYGPRLTDPRVRRAISLTVDRSRIISSIFGGRARVPSSYLVPPQRYAAEGDPAARPDVPTARGLMAAAGYRPGTFGILERGGDRLVVTLLVASGSDPRLEAARMVAGDLAAIGIAADVRQRSDVEIGAAIARSEFDLALIPEAASDALGASDRYAGRAGPWFDVLALAARDAGDPDQRSLYAELQRLWRESNAALPLYQRLAVDVAPRSLAAVQPSPAGAPLTWNAHEWAFRK